MVDFSQSQSLQEQQVPDSEPLAAAPPSDEMWDRWRGVLEQLYLVEDRDLKDIIEIMKSRGFVAT